MIRHYRLVTGFGYQVESEVNGLLFQGWELYGSPAVTINDGGGVECAQAMIKREGLAEATMQEVRAVA